jgi:hypothetical protein
VARILGKLRVEELDEWTWILLEPLEFHVGEKDNEDVIIVPALFQTDFDSIPKPLWSIIRPYGKSKRAAVIHDYLYHMRGHVPLDISPPRTRNECDKIFAEALEVCGVNWIKRNAMYLGVRSGGWWFWNKKGN